jgi:hypothetical protein
MYKSIFPTLNANSQVRIGFYKIIYVRIPSTGAGSVISLNAEAAEAEGRNYYEKGTKL